MTIYLNDERDYTPIVEEWVRWFYETMDINDPYLRPGNETGEAPDGVKIIFDGFGDYEGEDENGEYVYEEAGNKNMISFAVFVHKTSLTEDFPEHEQTPWALIHRPKEEVCIWAWYDVENDEIDIIPFEENNSTELDSDFVVDLIFKIAERDGFDFDGDNKERPPSNAWPFPTKDKDD
jgi:hypothetical protein